MDLEKLEIFEISMDLGEKTWDCVSTWTYFEKDTLGKQLVRSANSIAANISEGFGRYHYADAKHFYYFARGSLYETKTWLKKAYLRHLIKEEEYSDFETQINKLGIKLNNFIKATGKKGA